MTLGAVVALAALLLPVVAAATGYGLNLRPGRTILAACTFREALFPDGEWVQDLTLPELVQIAVIPGVYVPDDVGKTLQVILSFEGTPCNNMIPIATETEAMRQVLTVPLPSGTGETMIPKKDWEHMVNQADFDKNGELDAVEFWCIDHEIRRVISEDKADFAKANVVDLRDKAPLEVVVLLPTYQQQGDAIKAEVDQTCAAAPPFAPQAAKAKTPATVAGQPSPSPDPSPTPVPAPTTAAVAPLLRALENSRAADPPRNPCPSPNPASDQVGEGPTPSTTGATTPTPTAAGVTNPTVAGAMPAATAVVPPPVPAASATPVAGVAQAPAAMPPATPAATP